MDKPPKASGHCRHYSYNSGPVCAQGIEFEMGAAMACMPKVMQQGKRFEPCAWREEYTFDEHEAWGVWRAESMSRMILILSEIPGSGAARDETWGKAGALPCPACKTGTVRWVRARSNGHLHAGCSTPNCFEVHQ